MCAQLLTGECVVQNDCLLFPLFPHGDLPNPREIWARARRRIDPGDHRPRIVIVPAGGETNDHGLRPSASEANAIDYVAAAKTPLHKIVSENLESWLLDQSGFCSRLEGAVTRRPGGP